MHKHMQTNAHLRISKLVFQPQNEEKILQLIESWNSLSNFFKQLRSS